MAEMEDTITISADDSFGLPSSACSCLFVHDKCSGDILASFQAYYFLRGEVGTYKGRKVKALFGRL